MPKVSVIIPTYNRAEYLCSAIRSVLSQTFQDFEIIVVDDASTDNTNEIVDGFNDSRIKYIRHETNKGGSAARNTGIKMSSGEYIAFLDDDDEWLPEKLELQVNLMENSSPKVGVVYTGFLILDRSTGKVLTQRIPSKRGYLFNELAKGNCIGTTSTPLLRKECFEKVGLFDENLPSSQDYDMWIRVSKEFHLEYIGKPLVKYYIHDNKISNSREAVIRGMETVLKKHENFFKLNKKGFSYHYLSLGVIYCLSGDVKKGRRALLKAIELYPFEVRHYFNLALSLFGADNFKKIKEAKNKLAISFKS
jgi:glycosyltransferase involved in cell wall biosynthesis